MFQYLHIDHEQVGRVIGDERIAFVAFTGSVAGGHAVQSAAAERFIGTGLELGGKDAAYVRADAALDGAVENLVDGAFFNSGQSCCAVERIYVVEVSMTASSSGRRADETYVLGDPRDPATTIGPMVRADAARKRARPARRSDPLGAKALIDPAPSRPTKRARPIWRRQC